MNMKDSEIERVLKALANKRRLMILRFLKIKKESSVSDIASQIKLSLKSTSRHLSVLFGADILEREQRNLQVFYKLSGGMAESAKRIVSLL